MNSQMKNAEMLNLREINCSFNFIDETFASGIA